MPFVTVKLATPIERSFRVEQVAGMLDVPVGERLRHECRAELPGLDESWQIGAIVGPSGSGKTTLARAAYGKALYEAQPWPRGRAIVDCLSCDGETERRRDGETIRHEVSIKEIARVLTAVGLGSVPTWLKPYSVLSTGEQFRANLARAILERAGNLTQRHRGTESRGSGVLRASAPLREPLPLLVFDEFTSSLDRLVSKTTSAAVARFIRKADSGIRFVAITCHADIVPWMAPDWVLDLANPEDPRLIRGAALPPSIPLRVERVPQALWQRFKAQHYLTSGLAASATCYGAFWEGEAPAEPLGEAWLGGSLALPSLAVPIALCAVVAAMGWKKTKRITRLVTLPEFQGLGIGTRLAEAVAELEMARGNRVTITASHPAIVGHCSRSANWRFLGIKKTGSTRQRFRGREIRSSQGRAVASFEFVK